MSQLSSDLEAAAQAWADKDPDPRTKAELLALIDAARQGHSEATAELKDAFSGNLSFGTAGLRAAMGPGPARMNVVVVRRAAAGLAAYLRAAVDGEKAPRAVVGYDARHNSEQFALDTAAIFTAAGIETFIMPAALPTPLLAFAVRALGCEAGVMVTASHNPAADNGYKVYLGGRMTDDAGRGSQIVPPFDADIAASIAEVSAAEASGAAIELAESGWQSVPDQIIAAYRQGLLELLNPELYPHRELTIAYTAMHGVGAETAEAVLAAGGFTQVTAVAEQNKPDPAFPTVSYPNPEEPGALDLALALANSSNADIVIANDPDADRLATAARMGAGPDAPWRALTGDEVGALLGAHVLTKLARSGTEAANKVVANSIVSSRLLAKIAEDHGYGYRQTLTGFKWISRVPELAFGYEEALGYCVAPSLVKDKDGISAALLLAELAADLKAQGRTFFDLLDELAVQHGLYATTQLSLRVTALSDRDDMLNRLAQHPLTALAGSPVTLMHNLAEGSSDLPATEGLLFLAQNGTRVIVRPSGTEPKLKCYLEVIEPVTDAGEVPHARQRASETLAVLKADLEAALRGTPVG